MRYRRGEVVFSQGDPGQDDERHVFYLDVGAKFLDDKGVFLPDTFRPDNLHPQAKGYDIWGEAVKDRLAELMKQH